MRQASELSTLWLSGVKWWPSMDALWVQGGSDRQRDGNLHWTGGGSAHLPCEGFWNYLEWCGKEESHHRRRLSKQAIPLICQNGCPFICCGLEEQLQGLTREQNVPFGGWSNAVDVSLGIGDDQAEAGISLDGLVILQMHQVMGPI